VNIVSLETQLAKDVPVTKSDVVQIQQVIVNLVRNAIEALATTTERPKSLLISSRRDGDNVVVDVQDHGPGLADLEKIFELFTTTKETGIGMGRSHLGRAQPDFTAGRGSAEPHRPSIGHAEAIERNTGRGAWSRRA
jgi:K+-sensing histidine kinase KdpD